MSENDTLLQKLNSDQVTERLNAARYFWKNPSSRYIPNLKKALSQEKVSHIRTALMRAINQCDNHGAITSPPIDEEKDTGAKKEQFLYFQAVDKVTGMLLHELEPKIGLLEVDGAEEIPDFANSKVRQHIKGFQRVLGAISQLRNAVARPQIKEFELSEFISEILYAELKDKIIDHYVEGSKPFVIRADEALLAQALSNGIRNSIEALETQPEEERGRLVIDWGKTDVDYWITILDGGPGLHSAAAAAFEVGTTNKAGHTGFGLAITKQSMESIEGSVILEPAHGGGTRLELRWSKDL